MRFSITASGFWTCSQTSPRLILIVRLFATAKSFCDRLRLSRSTIHKMVRMSFIAYVQLPGIFDCSVRRLNMLEDRRSPPHNRFCSNDCSRSLRLVVRSFKIACDYRAQLVLYVQVANLVVSDRKPVWLHLYRGIQTWYTSVVFILQLLHLNISSCRNLGETQLVNIVKGNLIKGFKSFWHQENAKNLSDGKLYIYFSITYEFCKEPYLNLDKFYLRKAICKLRISAHTLLIET